MTGECEIERGDDHGFGQDGSICIVPHGVKVVSSREGISGSHVSPRGDFPDKVKVLKKEGPASLPSREFARVFEIG